MGKPARPSSNILALLVLGAIAALRYLWFATRSKTAPVAAVRPANADPQPAEPQPRVCVACAASEPDPPALRRSKSMAENSVLLCITVLFGVFGVLQFREADDPVVNPPSREFSIAVGAPSAAPGGPGGAPGAFGSLNDGNGPIQVKDVVYSEEPAGRGNSVGVGVVLQFDRPIVGALPVALRMVFAVEDGFDNPSCSKSAAGFYGAPPSDSPKSTCKAQTHDGLARVDLQTTIADDHNPGPDSSQRKSIELSAQIDQVNGIGARSSRTRAAVQLPFIALGEPQYAPIVWGWRLVEPQIHVSARFTDWGLSEMDWSGTGPSNVAGVTAEWSYVVGGPDMQQAPGATGVRTDLIAMNGPAIFTAGVLLALAASAAIPLVQASTRALIGWRWRRRSPTWRGSRRTSVAHTLAARIGLSGRPPLSWIVRPGSSRK